MNSSDEMSVFSEMALVMQIDTLSDKLEELTKRVKRLEDDARPSTLPQDPF